MKITAITYNSSFDRWVSHRRKLPPQGLEYTATLKKLIKHGVPCHIVNLKSEPVYRITLNRNEQLVKVKV